MPPKKRPNVLAAASCPNGGSKLSKQSSLPGDRLANAVFPSPHSNQRPSQSSLQAERPPRQAALNNPVHVPVVVQQTGSFDPNAYNDFDQVPETNDHEGRDNSNVEAYGTPPSTPSGHLASETAQPQQIRRSQVFFGGCSTAQVLGKMYQYPMQL